MNLSPRELEVVSLVVEGKPDKLVAKRLGIAVGTVKHHLARIGFKLGVQGRLLIAVESVRRGYVK